MVNLKDYINYRLDRAETTFQDAVILYNTKSWNSCINRLYYASFYMVSALLLTHEIEAKTHNGVRINFFKEFIKNGEIDKKYGKLYTDLFAWRNEGDYADFIDFDEDVVNAVLPFTKDFLKISKEKIEQNQLFKRDN